MRMVAFALGISTSGMSKWNGRKVRGGSGRRGIFSGQKQKSGLPRNDALCRSLPLRKAQTRFTARHATRTGDNHHG